MGGPCPGVLQVDSANDRRAWGHSARSSCGRAHAEWLQGPSIARGSLWIVPDLWKTHRTRFPQVVGRAERVHTLHKAYSMNMDEQNKRP